MDGDVDVIVVGAGPTGLLLAGELALGGVGVTVLERLAEPDQTVKAGSINVASAEILDRRGLLPAAERVQRRLLEATGRFAAGGTTRTTRGLLTGINQATRRFPVLGHFAGLMFRPGLIDQDDPVLAAHTAVAGGVGVPQHDLEVLLAGHCLRLGVEIRRGVEVRGVRTTAGEGVIVETGEGELTAGWVVAADGGRSVIRKQLDIPFDGTEPQMVGYQAIADFDDASGLGRGWTWTPRGVYAHGPIPGRILAARFGPQPADRDAPVSLDELQAVVREVTGVPVTLTGLHGRATRWSDNARLARSYRLGRVLLAGDAAHVHSPFSAQGLNLGFGDAVNLGWKLAATITGRAPAGLLDTYESERQPIAAWVLNWTRAQVALLRGDEHTAQLRNVLGDELYAVPGVLNRMVALSSGIEQRYDVAEDAAAPVGTLAGDIELGAGGRIADHAHDGRFVLVDRSPDGRFGGAVRHLGGRITAVLDPAGDGPSVLMRPDGVIVWAGDDAARLGAAVERWVQSSTEALVFSSGPGVAG
ncbi:FAD-dependent oxidoreductase [Actinoplanes sp. NPDC051470]|uniref:FAD-dependent oxidoreductase n=1 Tax=Actinoplanes sp. NPDC051470 TaxID=3157224 RepID=UPI00342498A9